MAINDTDASVRGSVLVRLLDAGSREVRRETAAVELAPGERREVVEIGALPAGSPVYFLDARLQTASGEAARPPRQDPAPSFYWLPAASDVLDWKKSEWFYTPTRRFADLTAVTRLPVAPLEVSHRFTSTADGQGVEVTLHNPRPAPRLLRRAGGRRRDRTASSRRRCCGTTTTSRCYPASAAPCAAPFPSHALGGERPAFRYQGINVPAGGARRERDDEDDSTRRRRCRAATR